MACPVTPADVALELGGQVPADDPRLVRATDASCTHVLSELDWTDYPDPCPSPITQAITGFAVDLFRVISTAFGYFVDDAGIASTGRDLFRRWRYLIDPYRDTVTDDVTGATTGGWGMA